MFRGTPKNSKMAYPNNNNLTTTKKHKQLYISVIPEETRRSPELNQVLFGSRECPAAVEHRKFFEDVFQEVKYRE